MQRELKPRKVGDTLGEIFAVFVAHWSTILGIVAVVTLPFLIIQAVIARNIIDYDALANNEIAFDAGALRNTLIISLFSFAANALAAGAVVHAVAGAYLGRPSDIGGSISFAASHLGVLIIGSLLWTFGLIAGFILFVIPGIILAVGWVAWASALLIEGHTPTNALRRSWELTTNRKWQVFGVGIALFVFAAIVSSISGGIANALGQAALEPPNFNSTLLDIATSIIVSGLFSTATVVVYLELRARKESPDAVEADLRRYFEPGPAAGGTDLFR